jgi:hypothetical protein
VAVKKIKLDFSKVEERSGWNTKKIPEGVHEFKVASVEESEAQDGTDMLIYALVPTDPRYKTRRFPYYIKLQPNQYFKLRDLLVAAGIAVPKRAGNVDPNSPVGKLIACEVSDATGKYEGRSEIDGTYSRDILDDGLSEFAGDEDEDDLDEDEADEPEDEDEGDDLSAMSLPELKRLAKSLGITGYTKLDEDELIEAIEEAQAEGDEDEDDLDEDDLDDEDLDDEDEFEDDEDEEPEPAPKRRAPARAAPTRKAAAKAAPAKRVVRRR